MRSLRRRDPRLDFDLLDDGNIHGEFSCSSRPVGMSQKCQKRKWPGLFNYLVGAHKDR